MIKHYLVLSLEAYDTELEIQVPPRHLTRVEETTDEVEYPAVNVLET